MSLLSLTRILTKLYRTEATQLPLHLAYFISYCFSMSVEISDFGSNDTELHLDLLHLSSFEQNTLSRPRQHVSSTVHCVEDNLSTHFSRAEPVLRPYLCATSSSCTGFGIL